MKLHLSAPLPFEVSSEIQITGSKSESNRALLLQALFPNIRIENLSNSDDSNYMRNALKVENGVVDIHHAGTAMRFLTAFFASSEGAEITLTGSKRMQERPIAILVDALKDLGAEINYVGEEGFPPLQIFGKRIIRSNTALPADVSSQYISALLLIAPRLENGIELKLEGKVTSVPYIEMTCSLLTELGIKNSFKDNLIRVESKEIVDDLKIIVESDWSSASYFYSIMAMSEPGSELKLSSYRENSLQGDSVLKELYANFGVETEFNDQYIVLRKTRLQQDMQFKYDLSNAPDLAQTLAVTCFGLGASCHLTGLHTLKIKETDRLEALRIELGKLGADISVTENSLSLERSDRINNGISIDTYNDHRMAMAFAPLALRTELYINEAEVVSKSYPDFWSDLQKLGIQVVED